MRNHARAGEKYLSQNWLANAQWYEPRENTVINYIKNASIHGIKYVGEPKLHIFERLLWLSAFLGSAVFGGVLIFQMWDRYQRMPIVTVLNPSRLRPSNVPFPAVTICNVNQVKKSKIMEYLERVRASIVAGQSNKSWDDFISLNEIQRMCSITTSFVDHFVSHSQKQNRRRKLLNHSDILPHIKKAYEIIKANKIQGDPLKTLISVTQSCEEMVLLCLWQDQIHNCSELFHRITTDFGICCTFNMKPEVLLYKWVSSYAEKLPQDYIDEWKRDELQYANWLTKSTNTIRKYPRRQRRAGKTTGLSILLDADLDDYYCSFLDSQGFSVALHTPATVPDMSERGIAVAANAEVFVGISAEVTLADDSIKPFGPSIRHCVDRDTTLAKFNSYSETNCVYECIANATQANCSCVPYHMPRSPTEYDQFCSLDDLKCAADVEKDVSTLCEMCLPTCTDIFYKHQITALRVQHEAAELLLDTYPQFNISSGNSHWHHKHLSIIHFYFMDDYIYPKLRKQQFGVVDLLSNSGGLLGLCLGFSGLSLLEFVYFFTVRILCRRYRKKCMLDENCTKSDDKFTNDGLKKKPATVTTKNQYGQWRDNNNREVEHGGKFNFLF